MKYMGSKARHAKQILPIILKDRKPDQWYVEPFVGGANVIDKVDGNRFGADSNEYLIALLTAMSKGWLPPEDLTKDEYQSIKLAPDDYPKELVAYAGFQLSYGAVWFGSYRRDNEGKRNYAKEAFRNVAKQQPNLVGVDFVCCNYLYLPVPPKSLIYCDPPYEGTADYKAGGRIDHDQFWQWCRDKKAEGHTIFVSEYNAPDDFVCVWEKQVNSSLTKNTGAKKATEKLFTLRGNL